MTTVAVDTSALMLPIELDIRLFDELERLLGDYEAIVPAQVVAELDRLSEEGGTVGKAASVGSSLAQQHCRVVEVDSASADDAVLELATSGAATYVVTADRELADRVRTAESPAITPRGRRQLAIQPP